MWNKIQLLGRLTKDPEQKKAGSYDITVFSLAQNIKNKDNENAHFYDCKAWNKTAQLMMNAKKGDLILIDGKLEHERWEKNGTKYSKHIINVQSVFFLNKLQNQKTDESEGIYPDYQSGMEDTIF